MDREWPSDLPPCPLTTPSLVARCSLLVARCSLLAARSLPRSLPPTPSLVRAHCSLPPSLTRSLAHSLLAGSPACAVAGLYTYVARLPTQTWSTRVRQLKVEVQAHQKYSYRLLHDARRSRPSPLLSQRRRTRAHARRAALGGSPLPCACRTIAGPPLPCACKTIAGLP